jgi:hypothetical protein
MFPTFICFLYSADTLCLAAYSSSLLAGLRSPPPSLHSIRPGFPPMLGTMPVSLPELSYGPPYAWIISLEKEMKDNMEHTYTLFLSCTRYCFGFFFSLLLSFH